MALHTHRPKDRNSFCSNEAKSAAVLVVVVMCVSMINGTMLMLLHHMRLHFQNVCILATSQESARKVEIWSVLSSPDGAVRDDSAVTAYPAIRKVGGLI